MCTALDPTFPSLRIQPTDMLRQTDKGVYEAGWGCIHATAQYWKPLSSPDTVSQDSQAMQHRVPVWWRRQSVWRAVGGYPRCLTKQRTQSSVEPLHFHVWKKTTQAHTCSLNKVSKSRWVTGNRTRRAGREARLALWTLSSSLFS